MKRILITGFAGSGKSSVCEALEQRGYLAVDLEEVEGLFSMIDTRTGTVFEDYDNSDLEKVKLSSWFCDPGVLRAFMNQQVDDLQFYGGSSANLSELTPYFDMVVLLVIKEETSRERLSIRKPEEFGSTAQVQSWAFTHKQRYENELIQNGAIAIDAEQPLDDLVGMILDLARKTRTRRTEG
jgi:dephospho-CoA kinase